MIIFGSFRIKWSENDHFRIKNKFHYNWLPEIIFINPTKISVKISFGEISVISTEIKWNLLEFTGIFDLKNPVELETTGSLKLLETTDEFLAPSQLVANWNFQPSSASICNTAENMHMYAIVVSSFVYLR